MLLSMYHAQNGKDKNPSVQCNALSKTAKSVNCNLTPSQAEELAAYLLEKAKVIVENHIEDAAVQVWNVGVDSERLSIGLIKARKGPRRIKRSRS
jgi:hypothetical protein